MGGETPIPQRKKGFIGFRETVQDNDAAQTAFTNRLLSRRQELEREIAELNKSIGSLRIGPGYNVDASGKYSPSVELPAFIKKSKPTVSDDDFAQWRAAMRGGK